MMAVRTRWSGVFVYGCLVLASLGAGRAVAEAQAIPADPRALVLGTVGVMCALGLMLMGPVICIAAIVALSVLPLLPALSVGGGVDVVAADAFFVALAIWWLIRVAVNNGDHPRSGAPAPVRGGPVLLFLGYAGLTLLYVAAIDPDRLPISLVSWLRLLQTASLGWLAAFFLRTRRDVAVVLVALAMATVIDIVLALAGGAAQADAGPLGLRGGGIVNPNELGLVAGLLVLMAMFGALGPSLLHRVPLALIGGVGLVQSQSVGSLVATSVALALGAAFMVPPPRRVVTASALRAVAALGVGVLLAYGVAAMIRPADLPTSEGFRESSAGQRTLLAVAGIELAERNPVIGVGWRRSDAPAVIGDPELNAELRARFPATKNDYFPDVTPGSVHNAYVQVVADLGLIGFGVFLFMVVSLGVGIRRVVQRAKRGDQVWRQLWFLAWGSVLILIWLNDNPIYGGQAETVVIALCVGATAGLGAAMAGTAARPPVRGA